MISGTRARSIAGLSCLLILLLCVHPAHAQDDQLPAEEKNGWPCGKKLDPSYIQVAEGSGGQVLMLDPSETSRSMVLMEAQFRGVEETVFRAGGRIGSSREYAVPVDSTVEIITFSVFVQCMESISILLPDGSEFKPGQGGPGDNVFHSGRVFTLEKPVPGEWRVRVAGKGYHSVVVLAKTELAITRFDFVKAGGRPGHEGYFPVHEVPAADSVQTVSLMISGSGAAEVKLVSAAGEVLSPAPDIDRDVTEDGLEIFGTIRVPATPFRVLVEGKDAQGFRWQRIYAPLWTPGRSG